MFVIKATANSRRKISCEFKVAGTKGRFRFDDINRNWWKCRRGTNSRCELGECLESSALYEGFVRGLHHRLDQVLSIESFEEPNRAVPLTCRKTSPNRLFHLRVTGGKLIDLLQTGTREEWM